MIVLSNQAKQEFEQMAEAIDSESALKLAVFGDLIRKHKQASDNYFVSDWSLLSNGEICKRFVIFTELDQQLTKAAIELAREGLCL